MFVDLGIVSLPGRGGIADLSLKDLKTSGPILCGDDVVCLRSKEDGWNGTKWVVTIDMRNKAVRELMPLDAHRSLDFHPTYIRCALHKYLMNGDSGNCAAQCFSLCPF